MMFGHVDVLDMSHDVFGHITWYVLGCHLICMCMSCDLSQFVRRCEVLVKCAGCKV